jgi:hypothetical protein
VKTTGYALTLTYVACPSERLEIAAPKGHTLSEFK